MHKILIPLFVLFSSSYLSAQFEFAGGPFGALAVDMAVSDSATYVVTLHSVYRSFDEGNTWKNIHDIPMHSTLLSEAGFGLEVNWRIRAHQNKVLLFYYQDIPSPPFTEYHLWWSEDYGTTWQAGNFPVVANVAQQFGTWHITDSLIFMQREKHLFYTNNTTGSWNILTLPDDTEGFAFDDNDLYYWSQNSIVRSSNFPSTWQSYPLNVPLLVASSIEIRKGNLFGISFNPTTGSKNFWASKGINHVWKEKPELAGILEFDVLVKDDSVFVWPQLSWEADYLWKSDTAMITFARDENRQTPVNYYASLMTTRLLQKNGAFFIFTSNRLFFRPYSDWHSITSFWRSDDSGLNWKTIEAGIGEPLINDCLIEANGVWVATPHALFRKRNDESFWEVSGSSEWSTYSIARFANDLWRISDDGGYPRVFRSSDNGATWVGDHYAGNKQLISTPEALFLNIGSGFVIRLLPQDNTWVDISQYLPDELSTGILDLWYNGKIFTYDGQGVLYASDDLGQSWQTFPFPTPLYTPLRLLNVVDEELYFVGGRRNPSNMKFEFEMFKWDNSVAAWGLISDQLKLDYTWKTDNDIRQLTGIVKEGNRFYLGIRGHGIFQSSDGGVHWEVVSDDEAARNTIVLGVSNHWLYNISQFFGVWKMLLKPNSLLNHTYDADFNIHPNPGNGIFNIELGKDDLPNVVVRVFSISGKLLYERNYDTDCFTINLSGLADGAYLISIGTSDQQFKYRLIQLAK